jgi:class 3 adenylate cyclase/tetratricopeptide (TPR) repeat protein
VAKVCASCGAELTGEARFCSSCGAAVEAPAEREARKVVTALFADVVGSTTLGERMDPEDFKSVVGEAVSRMTLSVQEFGGGVSEFAGDGLLALFGAPVAHEDDAERAVLAGLRIVESCDALAADVARDWGIEGFAVRVGIETGLAVLGPVGAGARIEYGAVGDALNTAARLQAASDPGVVLVGAQTQRSIARLFEWGEPRELTLKGKAEPVRAFPALGARSRDEEERAVGAAFVGRDAELARAGEVTDQGLAGSGGVLIVAGEAGIGKSRLLAELRERFVQGKPERGEQHWLEGRCVSYGESLPYWPFRAVLRECLELAPAEHRPFIEVALGSSRLEDLAPGLEEEAPRLIQEAAAATLVELAAQGPLAVALDDMHWADASSLALLGRLFELTESAPILLVLAARSDRELPFWQLRRTMRRSATEIELRALAGVAGRALLASLVGSAALPRELEHRLLSRAEGNPFYLEELVRSLVDAGALVRAGADWRFDPDVPVDLPETIEKLILARVDRLGPASHELLAVAAVLGRQFTIELLREVASNPTAFDESLEELRRAELLGDSAELPAPGLSFRHTLIQEATYNSLLKRRRQELHVLAMEAIERLYEERMGGLLGMLAHHATAAGDDERALRYQHGAGEAARAVYAVDEAIEHYTGALDAAARLGLDGSRLEVRQALLHRARLRFDSGDTEAAFADLEAADSGAHAAGDVEMQVAVLLGKAIFWRSSDFAKASAMFNEAAGMAESQSTELYVRTLGRLSIQYSNQLQFDRALEVAARALAVAEAAEGEEDAVVAALDAMKLVALQLGDLPRLERHVTRLLGILAERPEEHFFLPWAMLEAAFVPLGAGRFDEALARIEAALEEARRLRLRAHEPVFIDALSWTYRSMGQTERAVEAARDASARALEVGSLEWGAWCDATLGWALIDAGRPGEAAQVLERGLAAAETLVAPAQITRCTCLLAQARAELGEMDAAAELATRGEELLGRVTAPPGSAWLFGAHAYVAVARALLALGVPERAERLIAPVAQAARDSEWRGVAEMTSAVERLIAASVSHPWQLPR